MNPLFTTLCRGFMLFGRVRLAPDHLGHCVLQFVGDCLVSIPWYRLSVICAFFWASPNLCPTQYAMLLLFKS